MTATTIDATAIRRLLLSRGTVCPCLNTSGVGAEPAVDEVSWFGQRWVSQPMWLQVKYGLYQAGCDSLGPPSRCSRGPGDTHAKDKCHTRDK